MIAMALLTRPELLIADEPTTALDVTVQAQILTLLRELRDELNMGLLFITHNLSIVRKLADSVAVMQNGRCVEQNTALRRCSARQQHPYTQRLLDSEPSGDPVPLPDDAARRCCALRICPSRSRSAKVFSRRCRSRIIRWCVTSAFRCARVKRWGWWANPARVKAPPVWRCCA